MFVIIPKSGFTNFANFCISPFLSIPISNTPKIFCLLMLNKLNGTPYLLLNEFFE